MAGSRRSAALPQACGCVCWDRYTVRMRLATKRLAHAHFPKQVSFSMLKRRTKSLVCSGAIDDGPRSEKDVGLAEALEALRAGAPVKEPRTKAFGCLIKHER